MALDDHGDHLVSMTSLSANSTISDPGIRTFATHRA